MAIRIATPPDFDFVECINAHGCKSLLPFRWNAEARTLERVERFGASEPALLAISTG